MCILKVKEWANNNKVQFKFASPSSDLAIRLVDKTGFKKGNLVYTKKGIGTVNFFHSDFINVSVSFVVAHSCFQINDIEHITVEEAQDEVVFGNVRFKKCKDDKANT